MEEILQQSNYYSRVVESINGEALSQMQIMADGELYFKTGGLVPGYGSQQGEDGIYV